MPDPAHGPVSGKPIFNGENMSNIIEIRPRSFLLYNVLVYDKDVEDMDLTPLAKSCLISAGISRAMQLKEFLENSDIGKIDSICRSKNGKANALLYDQVTTALDRTVFTNAVTGEFFRANDKWEVFCGSLQSRMFGPDGLVSYHYMSREEEASHVMSYRKFIQAVKDLHWQHPKLSWHQLKRLLGQHGLVKTAVREMVLKELGRGPATYTRLRQYSTGFVGKAQFDAEILTPLLKEHRIMEFIHTDLSRVPEPRLHADRGRFPSIFVLYGLPNQDYSILTDDYHPVLV